MDFLDFELRISNKINGRYPVEVTSPGGEGRDEIVFPIDQDQLCKAHKLFNSTRSGSSRKNDNIPTGASESNEKLQDDPNDLAKKFGKQMFEDFLNGSLYKLYESSYGQAWDQGKGLRVKLCIDAPELACFPWEYAYATRPGDFLCRIKQTPVIRYLRLPRPAQTLTIQPPLRILGMIASPNNLPMLDVEKEKSYMHEAIHELESAGYVKLTWVDGHGWRDLLNYPDNQPWHVFHFIGHGHFDSDTKQGEIMLVGDDGKSDPINAEQLITFLGKSSSSRLIVLNSCEGARASDTDIYSCLGSALTEKGIPAVISMQYEITDRAALEFSRSFYSAIARGESVECAVTNARIAIWNTLKESFEWGTPVLHMHSADGRLFNSDIQKVFFPETTSSPRPIPNSTAEIKPASGQLEKNLTTLLDRVNKSWIQGVLEPSMAFAGLIDLTAETLPALVDSPWGPITISENKPIEAIFEELGGLFLILGVPGAGKTTTMLLLVRHLIAAAEANTSQRIPVVFNLSSWRDRTQTIRDWIESEMTSKIGIPRAVVRPWLDTDRLSICLDGLDEVAPNLRESCVEAINMFLSKHTESRVIVCCRFAEYTALPTRLKLNGAIRLEPLSKDQVEKHLEKASNMQGLQRAIEGDSSLALLAQSPFMLSLMMHAYRDLPPEALAIEDYAKIADRRSQLMEAYIARQFRT